MATKAPQKKNRKVMKAQTKHLLWDEDGNLVDKNEFYHEVMNNKPARKKAPVVVKEEAPKEKKKLTRAEMQKAKAEYFALMEKVTNAKTKKHEIKKPQRAKSVGDFGEFIRRQNASAKKHVQQKPEELPKSFTYSLKRSQKLTKNRSSSVYTPRQSRANSVVADRSYLNDFEYDFYAQDDASSVRSYSKPGVKFSAKHFEKLDREREARLEARRQQILKEQEVKPRIVKRSVNIKSLEELAKPKSATQPSRQSRRNNSLSRINKEDLVEPEKIDKKPHKVPKYVSEVRTLFKKFKED